MLTYSSCSSISRLTDSKDNVIESIIVDSNNGQYNKTLSSTYISRFNINLRDLNIWQPCKHELEKENIVFTEKEINYLNKQFKNLKSVNLKSNSPNLKFIKDPKNSLLTFITLPIILQHDNYAVYYSEQRYGGQINLLKKENNEWILYCSYLVWIE